MGWWLGRESQCLHFRIFAQAPRAELELECGPVCCPSQLRNTCNNGYLQMGESGGGGAAGGVDKVAGIPSHHRAFLFLAHGASLSFPHPSEKAVPITYARGFIMLGEARQGKSTTFLGTGSARACCPTVADGE